MVSEVKPAAQHEIKVCGAQGLSLVSGALDGKEPRSLAEAAEARGRRHNGAVKSEPADYIPYVERSELCRNARRCVWSWASGCISGRQCVLRLQVCESVAKLLKQAEQEKEEIQEGLSNEAALWLVGCVRLGGDNTTMGALRDDLENKSPTQILMEAWAAVEAECGDVLDNLDMEEVNSALRRLSASWKCLVSMDPGNYIRVQVWRELIRLSEGAEDDEELWGDQPRVSSSCGAEEDLDDTQVLEWIRKSERQIREKAATMSADQLSAESGRLLDFAAQMLRMGSELKEALEGLENFDAYRILGVPKDAPMGVIRRAFYKKALKLHPDKGGDKEAFQELQRAYDEIVSERRSQGMEGENQEDDDVPATSPRDPGKTKGQSRLKNSEGEAGRKPESSKAPEGTESAEVGAQVEVNSEVRHLDMLVRSALTASAGTGQCAVEASRHFWDMLEALELEGQVVDMVDGCATAEAALMAAEGVVEAARLVEQHARMVRHFILDFIDRHEEREEDAKGAGEEGDAEGGSEAPGRLEIERSAENLAAAGNSVTRGVESCTAAMSDTSSALTQSNDLARMLVGTACVKIMLCGPIEKKDEAGESVGSLAMLRSAVGTMVDSTQALALAALDASVATADAAKVVQAIVRHNAPPTAEAETAEGSGESAPSEEAAPDDGEKEENEGEDEEEEEEEEEEEGEQTEKEEDAESSSDESHNLDSEAWRSFETRWSLSTLLEAVRMLRVTNRELKHAQRQAKELGEREKRAKPTLTADHRKRAFALLMEFLDEASVRFHELLQASVHDTSGDNSAELGSCWVVNAVERSFGFLLRCRAELAVSLDPRAQTLRAALAIDAAAVNQVVQVEVCRRLQNSLMLVLLDAKVAHAAADGTSATNTRQIDEAAALQALEESKVTLAQALVRLEAALSGTANPDAAGSATAGTGTTECPSPTGPPPPPPPPPPASPPPAADAAPPPAPPFDGTTGAEHSAPG